MLNSGHWPGLHTLTFRKKWQSSSLCSDRSDGLHSNFTQWLCTPPLSSQINHTWSFAQCVSTKLEVLPVWATAHALQRVFLACEPPPASCCVWTPVHAAGHTDALKTEQTWWFSEAFIFSILKWNEAKNACVESTNKGRLTTLDRCRMCDMGQQQRPGSHTEVGEKNKQGG